MGETGRTGVPAVQELALTCSPPHCPQTPLTDSEESLDFSVSLEQVPAVRGGAGRGQPSQASAPDQLCSCLS